MLGYREGITAMLSMLLFAAFLAGRPHLFAVFAIVLAFVILWNRMKCFARHMRTSSIHSRNTAKIDIRDLREDSLVSLFRPVLRISFLQRIQNQIESRIKSDILRSGSAQNPRILGIKSVLYPIISAIILIPAGILIFFLYEEAFIGIVLVPVFMFGLYFMTLKVRANERKSAIDEELAPFAALASIMESVNVSLFDTFVILAKSPANIFAVMKKEGQRIRDITALGMSPTDALMDLSNSHPNTSFRNFIEGYVSSFNTGGSDTARYLQEQSQRFFAFMQLRMTRYTKQADMIAQVILTIMLLLPMMGLSMMFFATGQLAHTMILLLIIIFPFITAVLIGVIQASQPKNRDDVRVSWIVFPAGIIGAILVYLVQGQTWEAMGAGVIITCATNTILTRKKLAESASIESSLPEFMRQITRFKNIGIDIMHAIKNMRYEIIQKSSKSSKFNPYFDGIVDSLYRRMSTGSSLEQSVSKTAINSWNARLVFFILGKVHESGGGTSKVLDDITRWVTEYADAKKEMIQNLRASLMTAFIGPVLMVMMTVVSDQLASEFEKNQISSHLGNLAITPPAAGLSEILTITAVVCMGVVLSKINYFTIKHTMFTGIITAVTMALLYAVPYFPDFGL